MGSYKHHSIIVTSFHLDETKQAHEKSIDIFGQALISEVIMSPLNGFKTFFIAPDGSKEERDESDDYDEKREEFLNYLESRKYEDEDGGNPLEYCEVCYGNDVDIPYIKSNRSGSVKLSDTNEDFNSFWQTTQNE